jgi:hypothetical protein
MAAIVKERAEGCQPMKRNAARETRKDQKREWQRLKFAPKL